MDCPEIRSCFARGTVPSGAAVDEHLRGCPHCRELFADGAVLGKRLAQVVMAPEVDPAGLLDSVEADLRREQGLRARLRAWPTWRRAGALVIAGLLLLSSQLVVLPRSDLGEVGAAFWLVVAVLLAALLWGALWWLRGPRASSGERARAPVIALSLLALPAMLALIVQRDASSWGSPGSCFGYGAVLVVPFILLAWLVDRHDELPRAGLAGVGALAGISANLLLHAHCPSTHLGHLLLGHATVGAAWVLGLALLWRPSRRDGRPSARSR